MKLKVMLLKHNKLDKVMLLYSYTVFAERDSSTSSFLSTY